MVELINPRIAILSSKKYRAKHITAVINMSRVHPSLLSKKIFSLEIIPARINPQANCAENKKVMTPKTAIMIRISDSFLKFCLTSCMTLRPFLVKVKKLSDD